MNNLICPVSAIELAKDYFTKQVEGLSRKVAKPLAETAGRAATAYAVSVASLFIVSDLIGYSDQSFDFLENTLVPPFERLEDLEIKLRNHYIQG